jgi:hypothetical protein
MTKLEAKKLFAMLIGALPSAKVNDGTGNIYAQMLMDLDFDLAQRAVARLLSSWEMACLPTIGEIRRTAVELQSGPVRAGGDAWGEVLEQTRRVGYCGTPTFGDPIVEHIVGLWGWREICLAEGPADRARFIELYDRLAKERRVDEVSGVPLPRRFPAAPETAKALTHDAEPERAAGANVGGLVRQIGRKL